MGTEERKARERLLRKKQILSAAIELIDERGFDKVTMDDIAGQAELSKGTLYIYFENKTMLFRAIRKEALQEIQQRFLRILQEDLPGMEIVQKMGRDFLDFIDEHPVHTHAIAIFEPLKKCAPENLTPESEPVEKELLLLMTRALQTGIQDGSIRTNLPPKIMAVQIGMMMRGLMQTCVSEPGKTVLDILKQHRIHTKSLMQQFICNFLSQIDMDYNQKQRKTNKND